MKIAVVAHIRYPIAEPFCGGMEAHTHQLCAGLRAAGHSVTLFAPEGSQDANLVPICAPYDAVLPWEVFRGTPRLAAFQTEAFARAFRSIREDAFDVVHNNSLFPDLIGWLADERIACVTSLHVPPFESLVEAVSSVSLRHGAVVTVPSSSQADIWQARGCADLRVVPNGVDTARWHPSPAHEDYLVWTGRIVPNKGLAHAIRAARIAGARLRIYGPIEDASYFAAEVEPWLGEQISYRGHLPARSLGSEIAGARGALVTPMWDEPFGLVAAEALACGVPVAAYDRGALGEVLGPCGILVPGGDAAALAEAIPALAAIDRTMCRQRAIETLSVPAMIARYEACYTAAIEGAGEGSGDLSRSAASASSCARTTALLANG